MIRLCNKSRINSQSISRFVNFSNRFSVKPSIKSYHQFNSTRYSWSSFKFSLTTTATTTALLVYLNSCDSRFVKLDSKHDHIDNENTQTDSDSIDEQQQIEEIDPPESIVNYGRLTFGSVCGICCGVFIKKGAKAIAFLVGAGFVFLQYLRSQGLVVVKWNNISKRYNASINRRFGDGDPSNPVTVYSIWNKFINFLTADFQSRATFVAGLGLGLRLG